MYNGYSNCLVGLKTSSCKNFLGLLSVTYRSDVRIIVSSFSQLFRCHGSLVESGGQAVLHLVLIKEIRRCVASWLFVV